MAIVQISQIQVRRGLNQDLPQLAGGELAWSQDTRQLYIGNGSLSEGAPAEGQTEILTQFSALNFTSAVNGNIAILQGNVVAINSNIATLGSQINTINNAVLNNISTTLQPLTSGNITTFTANNAIINYTLNQNSLHRTGAFKVSYNPVSSTVIYDEEYTEGSTPTDVSFAFAANSSTVTWTYNTTTITNLEYRIQSF
jgi:hypothetical protein